jgi:UDPglucose 6-dehydrogenase
LIEEHVSVVSSAEEAARGAHAIAVLTEWDEFKKLNYESILQSMYRPGLSFRRT